MTALFRSVKVPPKLSSRPIQSKGKVMLSGKSWVSKSMNVRAIMPQMKSSAPTPAQLAPARQVAYPDSKPDSASTRGVARADACLTGAAAPRKKEETKERDVLHSGDAVAAMRAARAWCRERQLFGLEGVVRREFAASRHPAAFHHFWEAVDDDCFSETLRPSGPIRRPEWYRPPVPSGNSCE